MSMHNIQSNVEGNVPCQGGQWRNECHWKPFGGGFLSGCSDSLPTPAAYFVPPPFDHPQDMGLTYVQLMLTSLT